MDRNQIMEKVDHTLLAQTATWEEIERICSQAIKYNTASVCIPPSYVKRAADYLNGKIKVCTVIGFPNGYNTTKVKIAETEDALQNGADEIDMVINLGDVKNSQFHKVKDEIKALKQCLCLVKKQNQNTSIDSSLPLFRSLKELAKICYNFQNSRTFDVAKPLYIMKGGLERYGFGRTI